MVSSADTVLDGGPLLIFGPFDSSGLGRVRRMINERSAVWSLTDDTRHHLETIACELVGNIIRHAGGAGRLRISARSGFVYCQAVDRGPGLARPYQAGWGAPPSGDPSAARGLWLVRLLSARLHIDSSPLGTTITAAIPMTRRLAAAAAGPA
jgi:anti-sigma regulatory factor (Ser/Thr protein kinase)